MKTLLAHHECYELRKFGGFWHRCHVFVEKEKVVRPFKNINKLNGENKNVLDDATQRLMYTINISVKKNFLACKYQKPEPVNIREKNILQE